ncbi:probable RNA-dependent RNA polymerase 1 [Mangifera indica]|uniref:probable RNA-dependent RNA polymerase 1 n=1 Tax=Mangifera indica TaxID=29780 RepID=UPI001CFB09CD|nr:probable RNA-dependent RNA polymerase 1 [Mangifera indica]
MGKAVILYGFAMAEQPEAIKQFLEQILGEGTVTDVGVQQNEGSRAYAVVHFTTAEAAETIKSLADEPSKFWYGNSYLIAQYMGEGPKPSHVQHRINDVQLHFGYQMSKKKFSSLWSHENVSVKFGLGLRKFIFFLFHRSVEYKLDLPYGSIRLVELRQLQDKRFLIIQLIGVPRIYSKDVPKQSFSRDDGSVQWVHEVDFTPSSCIGQSAAICLELPSTGYLSGFQKDFAYYNETEGKFVMKRGSTSSCNSDHVPIVSPPEGSNLPFRILFKINMLVQHGCIPRPAVNEKFFRMVEPHRRNVAFVERALETLFYSKQCCFKPRRWLRSEYQKCSIAARPLMLPAISLSHGLEYMNRVLVTPSKVYFFGPEIILSNHVLRAYSDDSENFIRVSFVNEDLEKIHATDLCPRASSRKTKRHTRVYHRILSTLRNGIVIGDKKFEFLAFSNSQLKENSLWMFASRPRLTAREIRESLGDFSTIRNVAKYSTRLGQSFSSSRESVDVDGDEIELIPDMEVQIGGVKYVFSDGIGKISPKLAANIAEKCGFRKVPSAFQIRYGGYKGVVAVDPTSSVKLSLRPSMFKYKSGNVALDILEWSKYQPCFLNRELVILLSTLGVQDDVFEKKQKYMISQLDSILTDPLKARETLNLMFSGEITHVLKDMLKYYSKPHKEPFLSMMLQIFRSSTLKDLRTKTRIFVPGGQAMMGCLDETGSLEYGQVFVQCSGRQSDLSNNSSALFSGRVLNQSRIVEGMVTVAKNPCLHPGDVRVLQAVDAPALHHMVDCIVFPAKGNRPHPNECSGSDLDGDIYFVCWDSDLIPPCLYPPMDYTSTTPKIPNNEVTIEDVEEFFVDYMAKENLGIICHAHIAFADKSPEKAMCSQCIELAKLASIAVDFSKTGVPAIIPPDLQVNHFPDYMEKPERESYESKTVIGKLYHEVKDLVLKTGTIKPFTVDEARQSYDLDMEVEGFKDYIDDAFYYKSEYDCRLGNLMDYFGILTEGEILSGRIMKMAKSFSKKRDLEGIKLAMKSLIKEARDWFNKKANESDGPEKVYTKASAWYYVTYHPSFWGRYNEGQNRQHFLSFPWCVHDKLLEIKKHRQDTLRALHHFSLNA